MVSHLIILRPMFYRAGLMISSLSLASRVFKNKTYMDLAVSAANFIFTHLYDKERKRLSRSFREGPGNIFAFADDYAALIEGNICSFMSL